MDYILYVGDFKTQFADEVTALIDEAIEDRQLRINRIDDLIENYVTQTGERPNGVQLDRLSSYILREELEGDNRPDKMTLEDNPIMTESQRGRRIKNEVSDEAFAFIGNDGTNHREPVRRTMTTGELMAIDHEARKKKDEKPSAVVSSMVGEVSK